MLGCWPGISNAQRKAGILEEVPASIGSNGETGRVLWTTGAPVRYGAD